MLTTGRLLGLLLSLFVAYMAAGGFRTMLWRTVQVCMLNNRVIGAAFPCLAVQDGDRGVVVLKGPLDQSHIVVSPFVSISGIEDPKLREANARGYIEQAWRARAFVHPKAAYPLSQSDLGLAINSRQRRTQDQLHIHVDCVRASVKLRLANDSSQIVQGRWSQVPLGDTNQPYWVTRLPEGSMGDKPVIELAASGLKVREADMRRLSIAIVATNDRPKAPNFVLLAQLSRDGAGDVGHAEELLDHDCRFKSAKRY